uniref:Leucine-rich repeat-containing protein 75A-like n=1 Tax=Athene cunicularia TaxID=194338 RepID=A0A663MJ32_ATHCN
MSCEWHGGVHPAAPTPLFGADKARECSFPQGYVLMCLFFGGGVVVGITFFLASSWGPPVWANFKIRASTGFCSTSNIVPLPCFLQDLGMESTSLDDVLYRYASFRNLVDPITHDLIISLARYIHCPKPGDSLGAMEKLCRQLTYHLSPHSQWRRQGIMKRKPQSCLKAVLMGKPQDNTVDLSGIPLTLKDLDRVTSYLQHSSEHIDTVELCFTELTDDMLLQLLPALCVLPHLTTLSLNGNRLTKAILRDLTETLKDPKKFPSVTWIDLGNNVDIFSLPQPFLVSLKRRCPKQGNLPTILEFGEGQVSDLESQDGLAESQEDLQAGPDKTDNIGLQQTDRTVEVGEFPNSEQGAATAQT